MTRLDGDLRAAYIKNNIAIMVKAMNGFVQSTKAKNAGIQNTKTDNSVREESDRDLKNTGVDMYEPKLQLFLSELTIER